MITSKNRLSRRSVIRAGGAVLSLPFLSAMLKPGQSYAQDMPKRFVVFYSPGGTLLDLWRPVGAPSSNIELGPMMSPLEPFKDRMTMVDGLDMTVAIDAESGKGHHHCRGMAAALTGASLFGDFADGPSVDQVIASQIQEPNTYKSLEFATGWGTGIGKNGPHSSNMLTMAGNEMAIPPVTSPVTAFNRLFKDGTGDLSLQALDAVSAEYEKVITKLGYEDRAKLQAHLEHVHAARNTVSSMACAPPNVNMTEGYYEPADADPTTIIGDPNAQSNANIKSGERVPETGRVMTDMLVAALACGLTRVGTMQWGDSEAKFMLNFLNDAEGQPLKDHHHGYQHDRGFQKGSLEIIYNWYNQQLAYLLEKMDAIAEPNGMSMLDNSIVLTCSEIQKPDTHARTETPFNLIGKAGGSFVPKGYMKVPKGPHNSLLLSLAKHYGYAGDTFGNLNYSNGSLAGLV